MMERLWRKTIWAQGAIEPGERKYRNLKRVWLPVYDLIAALAGITAWLYGSRLLNRLFDEHVVDLLGLFFAVVATICFIGVVFPRLWLVEILGKITLVSLICGYIAAILFYSTRAPGEPPNYFVVLMLAFGLPLALFRLGLLGEEFWVRHLRKARNVGGQ